MTTVQFYELMKKNGLENKEVILYTKDECGSAHADLNDNVYIGDDDRVYLLVDPFNIDFNYDPINQVRLYYYITLHPEYKELKVKEVILK